MNDVFEMDFFDEKASFIEMAHSMIERGVIKSSNQN
jgi:hypothetical protein